MLFISMFGCSENNQIAKDDAKNKSTIKVNNEIGFCKNVDRNCVGARNALTELYGKNPTIDSVGNVAITESGVATVIASVNANVFNDEYAIFLVQESAVNGGSLDDCHACAPKLAVSIYQYHNSWKPYAADSNVTKIGEWGRALGYVNKAENIKIIPIATEHFLISLRNSYGGQGYSSDYLSFIEINPSKGIYTFKKPIRYLGSIQVGASDCGATPKGEDWIGEVDFISFEPQLKVNLSKSYKKNCTKELVRNNQINIIYEHNGKEFRPMSK